MQVNTCLFLNLFKIYELNCLDLEISLKLMQGNCFESKLALTNVFNEKKTTVL
jgi:hypothetical protein